tara:strand:+ start:1789 stop:2019 length:231 start_codon:yes stop_codon:yes gene_type:complete
MNIEDKLDLMILEHDILEQLFVGNTSMTVTDKYGIDVMLSLTGLMDCDYYKWDIDRCEVRAEELIRCFVFLEEHKI